MTLTHTTATTTLDLDWANHRWRFLGDRALLHLESQHLFVADLHLGKAAGFRAAGIAVPAGTTQSTLARLTQLITTHQPQTLTILGDLLHTRTGVTDELIQAYRHWHQQNPLPVNVVAGNHDRSAGGIPTTLNLNPIPAGTEILPGIAALHDPADPSPHPALAGHLHPAASLYGRGRTRIRSACFWLRRTRLILPAFGDFTGCLNVEPQPDERLVMISDNGSLFAVDHSKPSTDHR
ncbi:ligase-associated DNA damage response endonuclease PdeM [Mucisphaera sp.]|uniref:ligase-associated DNA damage response endonuclease PdeM n=1 Tax=Mucisphaera sp. TaxID=2913024 RepID=UPI003D104717